MHVRVFQSHMYKGFGCTLPLNYLFNDLYKCFWLDIKTLKYIFSFKWKKNHLCIPFNHMRIVYSPFLGFDSFMYSSWMEIDFVACWFFSNFHNNEAWFLFKFLILFVRISSSGHFVGCFLVYCEMLLLFFPLNCPTLVGMHLLTCRPFSHFKKITLVTK